MTKSNHPSLAGRLKDKVAIVTGAASGIGKQISIMFAKEGATVALIDMNSKGVEETHNQIANIGFDSVYYAIDLCDSPLVEKTYTSIGESLNKIDILVNVAGGSGRRFGDGPVGECTIEGWEKTFDINLKTQFLSCKYALPYLLKQERSSIVNISTIIGMVGGGKVFNAHAYSSCKAGIIGLSRAMATYYADQGLRVNVISPGVIETPMSHRVHENQAILDWIGERQILTGKMGKPEDVAYTALFLASDESSFITGIVIPVDGGWYAQ
jgi:NAD(P)-dependent dehydrogenase (short-subunit alcohol dehydrogenase family)